VSLIIAIDKQKTCKIRNKVNLIFDAHTNLTIKPNNYIKKKH
jgi:hypothetical protein